MDWFSWLKIRKPGPKFEERHDIVGTRNTDSIVADVDTRLALNGETVTVFIDVEDYSGQIRAQTHVKNGQLYVSMDENTEDSNEIIRWKALCHEFMHVMLWKDLSYTHSNDEKSIFYKYVFDKPVFPTQEDIRIANDHVRSVVQIRLKVKFDTQRWPNAFKAFSGAAASWNAWLGRSNFFVVE